MDNTLSELGWAAKALAAALTLRGTDGGPVWAKNLDQTVIRAISRMQSAINATIPMGPSKLEQAAQRVVSTLTVHDATAGDEWKQALDYGDWDVLDQLEEAVHDMRRYRAQIRRPKEGAGNVPLAPKIES